MNSRTADWPRDEGVTEMITALGMGPVRSPFMAKADVKEAEMSKAVVSDRTVRQHDIQSTCGQDRQSVLSAVQ